MSDHKPSDRRRSKPSDEVELTLLPFMNLMTLLIPFLLASVQFVTLAVIDSSLPAIGQPKPSDSKKDEKPPLNLTIGITDEGFTVAGSAGVLGCKGGGAGGDEDKCTTVPKRVDGSYCQETQCKGVPGCTADAACHDYKALRDLVIRVKELDDDGDGTPDYDEEKNVIIAPNPDIPYYVLVGVMDSTRDFTPAGSSDKKDLFPNVVIAGGVK